MKSLKLLIALALFVTTVSLDRQMVTNADGTLTASWNVGVGVSQSWGLAMAEESMSMH